ncbi:MAG: hypothetical protein GY861_15970 [bacterium]|nr:hypothetical protein [bacterium]
MVMQVSNVFIDSFDAEVKLAYQADKTVRDTVRVKTGVVGSTHRFPKAGKGVATQHNRGNDVVAMNAARTKVTVTLEDWDAFDYEDIMDIEKINFDDKKIIAQNTAKAIGRREDQLIFDALETGGLTTTVGDGTAAFSLALVQSAAQKLDANNVPGDDRTIIYTAKQKEQFLSSTTVTSSDYNTVKALVQGEIDTFYGFKFLTIGDRVEGGLPRAAGVQQYAFAYHKQAVGIAIGKEMTSMVDWVPQKTAWQIGSVYSAGAIVIDDEGIVAIDTDDSP